MPLELLPCVLIAPLFMIVLDPPRAAIASDPMLPSVVMVPELLIVFAPPVADTPFVLSPVTLIVPAGPIVSVSPPFNSGVVGPCVVVSAVLIVVSASSANCGIEIRNAHRATDLTA